MIWAPTTGVAPSRQLVKGPRSRRSVRRLPAALFWSTGLAARRVFDSFLSAGHDNWRNIGPSTGQRCCLARLAPLHAVLAPCRASPRSSTGVRACRPLRPLPSRSLLPSSSSSLLLPSPFPLLPPAPPRPPRSFPPFPPFPPSPRPSAPLHSTPSFPIGRGPRPAAATPDPARALAAVSAPP